MTSNSLRIPHLLIPTTLALSGILTSAPLNADTAPPQTQTPSVAIAKLSGSSDETIRKSPSGAVTEKSPVPLRVPNQFEPLPAGSIRLDGPIERQIRKQAKMAFDKKTESEFVDVYRKRQNLFAVGEFWGKSVRALSGFYRYSLDPGLKSLLDETVADLLSTQTADGCISGYSVQVGAGGFKQPYHTDVWDRKYALLGLISAYEATGDRHMLEAAMRMADQLMGQVGPGAAVRVVDTHYICGKPWAEGFQGMESSSILEPFVRLYALTGKKSYLDFAHQIVEVEGGSLRMNIFRAAINGREPKDFGGDGNPAHSVAHAYCILSCFEGLAGYYRATAKPEWLDALLKLHGQVSAKELSIIGAVCGYGGVNNGLAPTEQFNHSAYYQTCPVREGAEGCTVARWLFFCRHMLQLTGDSRYLDQIEVTVYNALMGSFSPDGKQVEYHHALNGCRPSKFNYQWPFSRGKITCCYYNIHDALAAVPFLAVMSGGGGPVVNLYIPGTARVPLSEGNEVKIEQVTNYPQDGRVAISVDPVRPARFPIRLRIPAWSERTRVLVNGQERTAQPGSYLVLEREWSAGDKIELTLDMRGRLVRPPEGTPENGRNFQAVMYGPLVLARDRRLGGDIKACVEVASSPDGTVALEPASPAIPSLVQFKVPTVGGGSIPMIDYATSGNTWDPGSERTTWIPCPAVNSKVKDQFTPPAPGSIQLRGSLADLIRLQSEQAFDPKTMAAMADVFRARANGFALGEYWGKSVRALCHQAQYSGTPRLLALAKDAAAQLLATQTPDGCISEYNYARQPKSSDLWDRKYAMLGLLGCYELTHDPKILESVTRLADYTLNQIGPAPKTRIVDTGWAFDGIESSSILEPMVKLYRITGYERYLEFARYIIEVEGGCRRGSIFESVLAGKDVKDIGNNGNPAKSIAKAYESQSCFEGLIEYYRVTGQDKWKQAALNFFSNVLAKEITVIGSGSGLGGLNRGPAPTEQFNHAAFYQTCPVIDGMEGCYTARWMAFCRQLLMLSGESRFADQFELSMYNALLGSIKPDGMEVDYHTRLNGTRPAKINYVQTLNGRRITCCYYNVADSLALIPHTVVMYADGGPVLNLYIPGTARMPLAAGNDLTLEQTTDYPKSGVIHIAVNPVKPARFPIRLRIPAWSERTRVLVNGQERTAQPGSYLVLEREWSAGDKIELSLDMRCRLVRPPEGTPENGRNFQALARGPLVLARDKRLGGNIHESVEIAADAKGYVDLAPLPQTLSSIVQLSVPTVNGGRFPVIDFATSGNTWDASSERITWIPRPAMKSGK